ncbi:MAG: GGDEF domain-containing protein [Clostridia bacterium]|nr:GGDEF domain-containing protein [Clostridia bacterium]
MERIVLIAANFVAYLLFIYKCFTLIEGMLHGKQFGLLFRLLIGIINACLMVEMALSIPINVSYFITILVLYGELLIIFRKSLKDTLFVSVAVMMNIMCLRGMVIALFALATRGTLYSVCSNVVLFLAALLVSNLLEWLAIYAILYFVRMENLRFSMQDKTQSWYIIIWASLCVLFMFRSSVVYVRDYSIPNMFLDHLSYCFMLLLSFYYLLVYTFKLNKVAKIREANKNLSKALGNQLALQSALMRDAIFSTQANLTQNKIIRGLDFYDEYIEQTNFNYDAWFEHASSNVQPEYYEIYWKSLNRQTLIDNFNRGIEPKPFEYKRNDSSKWIRLVLRMFKDVETGDIYVFGYGFDIENEVRDRQALLHRAETDLFTGLYNKTTTETLIGQAIAKGIGILFLIDIDEFKGINDRFGHEAGDYGLKHFSEILSSVFSKSDIVGRVGGDEFMIFVKDTSLVSSAKDRANEILTRLRSGFDYDKMRLIITASIGIAIIDEDNCTFSEAYNQADSALYEAKINGRNRFVIYADDEKNSDR